VLVSTLRVYNTRSLVPILHVISSYSSPMGTDSSLSSLTPLRAPGSSQIPTTLSIDGCAVVNNLKNTNPPDCSVTPPVADHPPHPQTPSLRADDAKMIEDKSTLQNHAYSRAGIIKPGTYSRSLLRSAPRPKSQGLGCAGCTAVHSLGIEHCHKHDVDKNGKGPHKRLRR
jgi:hypothetical protein